MANKFLGQHFLKNHSLVKKIVAALELQKGDVVIEIGPGRGVLTFPLEKSCNEIGCEFFAIEKDSELAKKLREEKKLGEKVIEGDALKILPSHVSNLKNKKYKLVGNIPYYITGYLFRLISELEQKPNRSVFMVQEEVGERIVAREPRMNRLAASVQFWAEPSIIASVSKDSFSPPPKVNSSIILFESSGKDQQKNVTQKYYSALRILFAQPRKTILNNLAGHLDIPKDTISEKLKKLDLDPGIRPQNLKISDIEKISEGFF